MISAIDSRLHFLNTNSEMASAFQNPLRQNFPICGNVVHTILSAESCVFIVEHAAHQLDLCREMETHVPLASRSGIVFRDHPVHAQTTSFHGG
jgi:hypothetical protein